MKQVNSKVVLNRSIINKLNKEAVIALEMTGEEVLDQIVEAQVIPFGDSYERGGKTHRGGTLQESGYVNTKGSSQGHVQISFNTPYARRLYYHPEYNFRTKDNPNAKGKWMEDWAEDGKYASKIKRFYAYQFKALGGL